jgi:hypothetical protein
MVNSMKKAIGLTILLLLSALLIPTKVESDLPGEKIVLSIFNPLNYTRVDEPVIIRWVNLTDPNVGKLPQNANPNSFRVTYENNTEVPSQFDDLTAYGYEKYLVFRATVPANSSVDYYLYYTTGEYSPPEYTPDVNITETDVYYLITAQNYSGAINKGTGVMENINTTNSEMLLTNFGGSSYGATGWSFGWYQVGSTGAQTILLKQGPVRSIIVAKGEIWYNDAQQKTPPIPDPGSSDWNYTTIYLLYRDRVEALTQQVYTGTDAMNLCQARAGLSHSVTWMIEGTITLDAPPELLSEPFQVTIPPEYSPYDDMRPQLQEWEGAIFTIYPKDGKTDYGYGPSVQGAEYAKWADATSNDGTLGYGVIFYDSPQIVRIECADGRNWNSNVIELNIIQYNAYPQGLVPPGLEPLWYHWILLPHENVNYNYTRTEAEKAYHPLNFKGAPPPPPPIQIPVWVVYLAFFAAAIVVLIFFARKSKSK